MSSIYDWSLLAANNANADDSINWAEGQPPSSVNNSARAMMQRLREFITDLGGGITAQGSGNAIAVTAASPVAAYTNGVLVRFRAMSANTDKTTLNMNSLGARPVFKPGAEGVVPLSGGEIQPGGFYEALYHQGLSGGGGWFLFSAPFQQAVPVGMIAPFAMSVPPQGWLACNGQAVPRQTYSSLFAVIGTCWGGR